LNILDPYVDYFVLSEATETFSGIAKPLHFKDNIERFKKWEHKIIYCLVENVPKDEDELRAQINNPNLDEADRKIYTNALTSNNVGKDKDGRLIPAWFREFIIKEGVRKGLTNLRDDDICYISDLDEVWNPELVIDYSKDDVFKLIQIGYMYFLNNRSNEEDWNGWTGTVVTKYKNIKNVSSINHIRTHKIMKDTFIFLRNGGWHFAFQGGYEGAKRKIVESNHFWYKQEETLPNLDARVKNNQDYRGRGIKLWSDERGLPKFLLENKEKYKQFFR
jgi:beta-1,4-mannosyl-glycoprotein beta-1,4-N-acetylglucosaminyltransferase